MNGICKGKTPERALSFKSFASAEKSKLRTAYPFLSADQINGKIKEKWKLLDHKERQCYSKATLKVTPSKDKTPKRVKRSPRRQKKSGTDICDTPDHVNLFLLSDFRKQHTESYENEFGANDTSKHTVLLSRQNHGTAGTGRIRHVSNGSPGERKTSADHTSSVQVNPAKTSPFDWDLPSTDDERSSSQMLIKRRDSDDMEEMDAGDTESLDSDEDNDGILIRRTDLDVYNDVDKDMVVEELDDAGEGNEDALKKGENAVLESKLDSNFKENKNAKLSNAAENACNRNNCLEENLFKSPDPKGSAVKKCSGRRNRRSTPANLETPNISSDIQATLTPQVSNSNEETEKYTTPHMDEILQKLTIHEVNKAPQKRRHSFKNVDHVEKIKALVSGRRVTRSLLALQSVKDENVGEELEDESSEVMTIENNTKDMKSKGKKNTKLSLKNKKRSGVTDENNNTSEEINETELHFGDSIKETGSKSKKKNEVNKMNTTKSVDVKGDKEVENAIQMNPSGAASQVDQENMDVNFSIQTEVSDNNKGDSKKRLKRKLKVTKSDQISKRKKGQTTEKTRNLQTDTIDNYSTNSSTSSSCGSQPSSSASSLRSLTPLRKSCRNKDTTNPALERVLQSLRSTRMTSPTWSCSNSSVSSPRLLSPALSGVSELSSLSDQCSGEQQKSGDVDMYVNTAKAMEEKDLCDMFNDVTPPECKTKGLYKTSRMVASSRQDESSDFKQLFQDEGDDLFF